MGDFRLGTNIAWMLLLKNVLYILEIFLNLISTGILDSEVNWEATMIVVSRVLGNLNDSSQRLKYHKMF